MKDSELERRIQKSLDEGFTKMEVIRALEDDGYDEQRIRRILNDIESSGRSSPQGKRQGPETTSQVSEASQESVQEVESETGDSSMEPAGLGKRFGAVLLDGAVIIGISIVLMIVLTQIVFVGVLTSEPGSTGGPMSALLGGTAILLIFAPVIVFFLYYLVLEAYMSSTLGKRLLGLKIVSDEGGEISGVQSLIRNLLRYIDIFPAAYIVGVITILVSDENKRIGDIIAGTQVVKEG